MELSFGEQIKIILKRNNLTIQDLANVYETSTGVKMTRQNLSQRLRRDNFQEQDMHVLAGLLGYQVSIQLTPISGSAPNPVPVIPQPIAVPATPTVKHLPPKPAEPPKVTTMDGSTVHIPELFRKPVPVGDINPMTGEEYLTNTVRPHPEMDNYLQVYDQSTHEWTDVNEDYFWEFQASKKQILGTDYQEPIII